MSEGRNDGTETKGGPNTVLVIDDQAEVRRVIAVQLQKAGYRALEAEDGSAAIHAFSEHSREIVAATLDLDMPETNGRATLAMISEYAPRLPILVVTGNEIHDLIGRIPGTRGVGYLAKPFKNEELVRELQRLIAEMEAGPRA